MSIRTRHVIRGTLLVGLFLTEYLCFSNIPLVPRPGGGAPFGDMESFLPVSPRWGPALAFAQPLLCFPIGTLVTCTFTGYAPSVDSVAGWPKAVFRMAAPLGIQSFSAVRLNLLWLSAFNSLVQTGLAALAVFTLRRLRRPEAAA
jgi:hypothetical protein